MYLVLDFPDFASLWSISEMFCGTIHLTLLFWEIVQCLGLWVDMIGEDFF